MRRDDADTLGASVEAEDDLFLDEVKIEVEEICLDVPAEESM